MLVAKIIQDGVDILHCINGEQYEELHKNGYLEYVQTDRPICKEGFKTIPDYLEIDGKIAQSWLTVYDNQTFINEITQLKSQLSATDYQVTKCMEAQLIGNPLPYNIEVLHSERQQIRDRINELEILINTNNENRL